MPSKSSYSKRIQRPAGKPPEPGMSAGVGECFPPAPLTPVDSRPDVDRLAARLGVRCMQESREALRLDLAPAGVASDYHRSSGAVFDDAAGTSFSLDVTDRLNSSAVRAHMQQGHGHRGPTPSTQQPTAPTFYQDLAHAYLHLLRCDAPVDLRPRLVVDWESRLRRRPDGDVHKANSFRVTVAVAGPHGELARKTYIGPVPIAETVLESHIAQTLLLAERRSLAPRLPSMSTSVVLAPDAAAALMHEVFGHGLEVDHCLLTAAPSIAQVDVCSQPGPAELWCWAPFDDIGTDCGPRLLIRDGVLLGRIGEGPATCGELRRQSWSLPAVPRMRLLSICPREVVPNAADVHVTAAGRAAVSLRTGRCLVEILEAEDQWGTYYCGGYLETNVSDVISSAQICGAAVVTPGLCYKQGQKLSVATEVGPVRLPRVRLRG